MAAVSSSGLKQACLSSHRLGFFKKWEIPLFLERKENPAKLQLHLGAACSAPSGHRPRTHFWLSELQVLILFLTGLSCIENILCFLPAGFYNPSCPA